MTSAPHTLDERPLICHVVYRLDTGGLENGLVNVINHMPRERFRHAIVALTEVTEFAERLNVPDVQTFSLHKKPGKDPAAYLRLFRLLRRLRPAIVHTRNLGTLDAQAIAWAAGIPVRVHGEHGWDVYDPEGRVPRYVRLRRLMDRLVTRYVALSGEIETWLTHDIGIRSERVERICNGVDVGRFRPRGKGTFRELSVTIGTVTRLTDIKDPLATIEAFVRLRERLGEQANRVRLMVVGDGPLRPAVETRIREAGIGDQVELTGNQTDVASQLRRMDIFVLGSRREGISNTILEAMACGLPVVATRTGGNPELVDEPATGRLVPVGDADAMASVLEELVLDCRRRVCAGQAARRRAESNFSLGTMADRYAALYTDVLTGAR